MRKEHIQGTPEETRSQGRRKIRQELDESTSEVSEQQIARPEEVYEYHEGRTGSHEKQTGSYEKKMGVCQDLSAIMCCMLRTQGIPCRLIIGYADKNYHAWTVAQVGGQEMFFDPTAALSAISPPKAYSVERFY